LKNDDNLEDDDGGRLGIRAEACRRRGKRLILMPLSEHFTLICNDEDLNDVIGILFYALVSVANSLLLYITDAARLVINLLHLGSIFMGFDIN